MPLTKSEFDRWKAQRDEAIEKMRHIPCAPGVASIDAAGFLRVVGNSGDGFEPSGTRALYEMLRAWYGEDAPSPAMTAKAKAVIEAADAWGNAVAKSLESERALSGLANALIALNIERSEQKQ